MVRTFTIYETPHVADPAWVCPVIEHPNGGGGEAKQYADASELINTVFNLQFQLGRESGRCEEGTRTRKYLKEIGWSAEQIKAWAFWREAK